MIGWAVVVIVVAASAQRLPSKQLIRRTQTVFTAAAAVGLFVVTAGTVSVPAIASSDYSYAKKLSNLPSAEIAKIVTEDITNRQALATAAFTRAIYSENCMFQDEIDIYPIDQYVKGTSSLFNAERSHVDLIGDVTATADEVNFRFRETLAFNIPFQPKVQLSGSVKLTRGKDGLVEYSREFWDQTPVEVLKTVTFYHHTSLSTFYLNSSKQQRNHVNLLMLWH